MVTVSWTVYCVLSPGLIHLFATAGAEQMIFDTKPEEKITILFNNFFKQKKWIVPLID